MTGIPYATSFSYVTPKMLLQYTILNLIFSVFTSTHFSPLCFSKGTGKERKTHLVCLQRKLFKSQNAKQFEKEILDSYICILRNMTQVEINAWDKLDARIQRKSKKVNHF